MAVYTCASEKKVKMMFSETYSGACLFLLLSCTFITCQTQVPCAGSVCGANEVCVNSVCECEFGFQKEQGQIFCDRVPEFTQDKIIDINRRKGILHELFEGDIKLNPPQRSAIDVAKDLYNWEIVGRRQVFNTTGITRVPTIPIKYWFLPIPTLFHPNVPTSVRQIIKSMNFFRDYEQGDTDHVMVTNGPGCWSYVGRQGGMQLLSIDAECYDSKMIFHLSLHTLGLWHEQNRIDRDQYITLHPENMEDGAMVNFHRYHLYEPAEIIEGFLNNNNFTDYMGHHFPVGNLSSSVLKIDGFGNKTTGVFNLNLTDCSMVVEKYDVCSLLHIGPFAYSRNGQPVFSPNKWRAPCNSEDAERDNRMMECLYTINLIAERKIAVCFPPSSLVQLETGETKRIGDLMIGESIMVMDENNRVSFSDVNLMMHRLDHALVNYIILETEDGATLTLSQKHVVFVSSVWSFVPETRMAEKVKVGDYLYRPEMSNGTFTPVKVIGIGQELMIGAYAPSTLSGNMIVDGHLASSYAYIEDQNLAHSFLLPWRLGYSFYNSIFGKSLHKPAEGFHWSLKAFVSAYCTIVGHDLCVVLTTI